MARSERTDSPQIEMFSSDNTLKQGEGPGDPSKTLPASMINALSVNETNNVEQRKLVYFRTLGAVVYVNLRVVWWSK